MAVKFEEYNNICVMTFGADFLGPECEGVRKQVEQLIEKKQIVDFVVDFEKAGFIDSEGLETLLWLKRKAEDLFGQVKLAQLDDNCRKILEITRLEHRFECHADLTGALKTMR
ncbi:MAG TPA: STAS domain-containing protein [Tepidisphaeraceae bacterium]|jgi:anti-anti-sigma factor|nr:STAS domain-containing protein [Tepidisphaeraceae bacterium]